jgi:hypothetical protein
VTGPINMELINEYGRSALLVTAKQAHAILDVGDLDALIATLADIRADLLPPSPRSLAHDHQYAVETNPQWHIFKDPMFDGLIVVFRHTGFGWVGFGIPRENMPDLIETLSLANLSPQPAGKAPLA